MLCDTYISNGYCGIQKLNCGLGEESCNYCKIPIQSESNQSCTIKRSDFPTELVVKNILETDFSEYTYIGNCDLQQLSTIKINDACGFGYIDQYGEKTNVSMTKAVTENILPVEETKPINIDQIENHLAAIDNDLRYRNQKTNERLDKIERQLEELTQAMLALGRKMEQY